MARGKLRIIELSEHPTQDIQFVLHHHKRLLDSLHIISKIATSSILFQSVIHVALNTNIVNHKTFILTLIYTIHTRYCLD